MRRLMVLSFGAASYVVGMGSIVYMIGWLGNIVVPRSIDSSPGTPFGQALMINAALFMGFCLQHSVMARPRFKAWWTQYVPQSIERSTYVLASGIALMTVMLGWQPMGMPIWDVQSSAGQAVLFFLYGMGWAILVGSTFALNHFDLFGLRQVWLRFRNKPYEYLSFSTPGPYRLVRHPLYVGWITLSWATPTMSVAHFAFALATTVYILVAIQFEERDLMEHHGEKYVEYRRRTPMLVPGMGRTTLVQPSINDEPALTAKASLFSESGCFSLSADEDETIEEMAMPRFS